MGHRFEDIRDHFRRKLDFAGNPDDRANPVSPAHAPLPTHRLIKIPAVRLSFLGPEIGCHFELGVIGRRNLALPCKVHSSTSAARVSSDRGGNAPATLPLNLFPRVSGVVARVRLVRSKAYTGFLIIRTFGKLTFRLTFQNQIGFDAHAPTGILYNGDDERSR